VHITELGGEYFRFDEARQELRGERTGIRYAIGTRVRVQVSRVDLDGRKIDFRLVNEGQDLVGRAMKDKTGGHATELPAQERGAARHAGEPRTGKAGKKPVGKHAETRSSSRSSGSGRSTGGAGSERTPKSPIQALKAAVKKAAGSAGRKQGKKPRR
jgi:ribonuclease R